MKRKPKIALIGMDAVSLLLVRKFLNTLPNFRKLMEKGSANEALPCIPAFTPTNWATIATGAWPGTHGAGVWYDTKPGDISDKPQLTTFDSRTITAEFIWERAESEGLKCLMMQYPGAYPPRTKKAMIVAPLHRGLSSLTILRGKNYSRNAENPDDLISLAKKDGCLEGSIVIFREREIATFQSLSSAERAKLTGATEDGVELGSSGTSPGQKTEKSADKVFTLYLRLLNSRGKGYDRMEIYRRNRDKKPLAVLREGEWSPWVTIGGAMRFKLRRLSKDGKKVELLRSEIYPVKNFTYPASLSAELVKEIGPFFEHPSIGLWQDADTALEEIEYQVDWIAKCAKYLLKTKGWDMYYLHWHFPDSVLHQCLAASDPASPGYKPSVGRKTRRIIRRCLEIGDKLIGEFMKMLNKNDYLIVVSDHGNSANMVHGDVKERLINAGLLTLRKKKGNSDIDWSGTRAYAYGSLQVAVNLKGREPRGIVSPRDYRKVQEKIIDALHNWKDENGKRIIALALKREEAQLLGYWGERMADVYYLFNSGYGWGSVPGANHGPQSPFAHTNLSSNMAMFIISGPGIRQGYSRDPERMGYIRLMDVTPTICHILGIRPPRHSQGAVLYDLFTGDKDK